MGAAFQVGPGVAQGVRIFDLEPHSDPRGTFTEVFRESEVPDVRFVQWNVVHSAAGVLRGVHVHRWHTDYLTLISGAMQIGMCDLRRESPTCGAATVVKMTASTAILIPPGVAHGFHFAAPSTHLYAVSSYWDLADELGCHWADPALGIPWNIQNPLLSPRDAGLPSLAKLLKELE